MNLLLEDSYHRIGETTHTILRELKNELKASRVDVAEVTTSRALLRRSPHSRT